MKPFILAFLIYCIPITGIAKMKSVIIIKFQGINCQYCIYKMHLNLKTLPNVVSVTVSSNKVELTTLLSSQSELLAVEKIIYDSGYTPGVPIINQTD